MKQRDRVSDKEIDKIINENEAGMAHLHAGRAVADLDPNQVPELRSYALDFPDHRLHSAPEDHRGGTSGGGFRRLLIPAGAVIAVCLLFGSGLYQRICGALTRHERNI